MTESAMSRMEASDDPNRSLYELVRERVKNAEQSPLICQFIILFSINEGSQDDFYEYFDKVSKKYVPNTSGLVLIFPTYAIALAEGRDEDVVPLMSRILKDESSGAVRSLNPQILIASHRASERMFKNWFLHNVDIMPTDKTFEPNEPTEKVVNDILHQLLKLFDHLRNIPKASLKGELKQLYEKVPHFIPAQDVMNYLKTRNEPSVTPMAEFVGNHTTTLHSILDSEFVWPMTTKLFPLL